VAGEVMVVCVSWWWWWHCAQAVVVGAADWGRSSCICLVVKFAASSYPAGVDGVSDASLPSRTCACEPVGAGVVGDTVTRHRVTCPRTPPRVSTRASTEGPQAALIRPSN
jgi:hypothetical protein